MGLRRSSTDKRGASSSAYSRHLGFRRSHTRLANQRAFPHPKQQLFELSERLGSELGTPLALDVTKDLMNLRPGRASAFGQTDNAAAAFIGGIGPNEIAERFEAPQQLVHGLFAHAGALGEHAWADPIWSGELQHRHMGDTQVPEA